MAATELESLVVKLSLDIKELKDKSRQAEDVWRRTEDRAERGRRRLQGVGNAGVSAFGVLGKAVTRFATLAVGAFATKQVVDFLSNTSKSLQAIGINSRYLGVAANNLDGFNKAAEAAGSSAENLGNVLSALNEVRNYRGIHPLAGTLKSLQAYSGVVFDLNDDPLEMLKKIGEALKKLNEADRQIAASKLGIDAAMLQGLMDGTLIAQAEKLAKVSVVDDKKINQAKEFNKSISEMKAGFESVFMSIYAQVLPEMGNLNEGLLKFSGWIDKNGPNIRSFFGGVASAVKNVSQSLINDMLDSLNQISNWFDKTDIGKKVSKEAKGVWDRIKKVHEDAYVGLVDWIVGNQDKPASTPAIIPSAKAAPAPPANVSSLNPPVDFSKPYKKGAAQLSPVQIKAELMRQGWSENAALGILANIQAESGFDHRAMGDFDAKTGKNKAYGYFQMHPHYAKDLPAFTGKKIGQETPQEQLRFFTQTLKNKHPRLVQQVQAAKTAAEAAKLITLDFERPANKHAKAAERANIATNMARAYKGGIPPTRAQAKAGNNVNQTINISRAEIKTEANNVQQLSESITSYVNNHRTTQSIIRGYR